MAELTLDVHLELDPLHLNAERDPVRAIAELSHRAAEEQAQAAGARLRHGDPIEVESKRAIRPLTGDEVLLVATRWICDRYREG